MARGFKIVRTPVPVYVRTEHEALKWVDRFYDTAETAGVGFDTETTGLDSLKDRIRFFSFAQKDSRIAAPLRLLPVFRDLLEDPDVPLRMTNAKYDMHMAGNHGIHVRGHVQDSADQDFLYDENRQGRHGLKPTSKDHLGLVMTPFKRLFGDVGRIEEEVRTLCHVHDILELHDHRGKVSLARERATRLLVRLKKVDASPVVLKALKRVDLSIRGGCTLDARKVLKIARDHKHATKTSGKRGYVSDFVQFLGGPVLATQDERAAWEHMLEEDSEIEEAHNLLWDRLLTHIDLGGDPVERLRVIVTDYASLDAWASYMLVDLLRGFLEDEDMLDEESVLDDTIVPVTLLEHSEEVRVPFVRTLFNMERRGFRIAAERCTEYAEEMGEVIDRVERDIVRETQDLHFNPGSTDQLIEHLFEETPKGWVDPFGDKPRKMTDGGQTGIKKPSTAKSELEHFSGKGHHLSTLILEHRQFSKLKGTYMDGLPTHVDRFGRIHTSLKSTGARTWRIASANPNLQNIPSKDPVWGPRIRKLFIPGRWGDCSPALCLEHLRHAPVPRLDPDHPMTLIVADYDQLEMKLMAHFCRDPDMVGAILDNKDLHCQTVAIASELGAIISGITYEIAKAAKDAGNPTQAQLDIILHRKGLKATGFGIIYGIGALKLGMQLGMPIVKKRYKNGHVRDWCPEAQKLINDYLESIYPGVGQFIRDTHEICREDLAVYTLFGHPRRLPDIISRDRGLRGQAERQSVNSIIQGSGADITNRAMLRCEGDRELRRLGVRLLLQIHDELVFEVPKDKKYIEPARARIKVLMEDLTGLRVPITISMDVADSWGDAK